MTPDLYSFSEIKSRCEKINLTVGNGNGLTLMIYAVGGNLLRGFEIQRFIPERINARDFDNWWRFMGYDK